MARAVRVARDREVHHQPSPRRAALDALARRGVLRPRVEPRASVRRALRRAARAPQRARSEDRTEEGEASAAARVRGLALGLFAPPPRLSARAALGARCSRRALLSARAALALVWKYSA